ncbi:Gfo/Idh/MocA family oxidoreductase [Helcococcus bovis]
MPLFRKIKAWIEEHNLGKLKMIQVNFGTFKNFEDRYFFKKELAGGALFDIGVYALNFVRFFISQKPDQISSYVNIHESGVDESSSIILKNKKEELATVSLTFRAKMPKRGLVAYEKGYVEINEYPHATEATLVKLNGERESLKLGDSNRRLAYEVEYISELLEKTNENKYLNYTIDVLEIMDELRQSWKLKYEGEEV